MTKRCSRCNEVFDISDFGMRRKLGKLVIEPCCPICTKVNKREHYAAHHEVYKARARKRTVASRKENRKFIAAHLMAHPCVDCGQNDFRVLQFDHTKGKKQKAVSTMLDCGIETIKAEIEKCDVRCANCHLIVTGKRAKVWWTRI